MGLLAQTAEPAKEVLGVESGSQSSRTRAISRLRTSKPASRPGWMLTCRGRSVVPQSEPACFAKTSSATTQLERAFSARRVGSFIPIRLLDPWLEEDQLPQQPGLPRLPDPFAMHGQSIPLRVSFRERGRIGPHMQARIARHPDILDRGRETVEHPFGSIKQWMNQGGVSDARIGEGSRRVQPDRTGFTISGAFSISSRSQTWIAALQA